MSRNHSNYYSDNTTHPENGGYYSDHTSTQTRNWGQASGNCQTYYATNSSVLFNQSGYSSSSQNHGYSCDGIRVRRGRQDPQWDAYDSRSGRNTCNI